MKISPVFSSRMPEVPGIMSVFMGNVYESWCHVRACRAKNRDFMKSEKGQSGFFTMA